MIKRAKLFLDEQYQKNLHIIEDQAKALEEQMEEEEKRVKLAKHIHLQREQASKELKQQSAKTKQFANPIDDDDFLFGENIKIDESVLKKIRGKSKPVAKESGMSPMSKKTLTISRIKSNLRGLHINKN